LPNVQTAADVAVCGVLKLCHMRNASGTTATYTVKATHTPMMSQLQSNREPEVLAPLWTSASDVVVVVVVMVVPLVMMMMLMGDSRILAENE
jgi:hypothetical protein